MKFEFIEKEKPKKIWVNETEAHKYLDALIKANPICFREYIAKVKADAIDKLLAECDYENLLGDKDNFNRIVDIAEQLKEQSNGRK